MLPEPTDSVLSVASCQRLPVSSPAFRLRARGIACGRLPRELLTACAALCAASLPAQATRASSDWMALEVGTFWDFDSSVGTSVSIDCVAVDGEAGVDWFLLERCDGTFKTRERWSI